MCFEGGSSLCMELAYITLGNSGGIMQDILSWDLGACWPNWLGARTVSSDKNNVCLISWSCFPEFPIARLKIPDYSGVHFEFLIESSYLRCGQLVTITYTLNTGDFHKGQKRFPARGSVSMRLCCEASSEAVVLYSKLYFALFSLCMGKPLSANFLQPIVILVQVAHGINKHLSTKYWSRDSQQLNSEDNFCQVDNYC